MDWFMFVAKAAAEGSKEEREEGKSNDILQR